MILDKLIGKQTYFFTWSEGQRIQQVVVVLLPLLLNKWKLSAATLALFPINKLPLIPQVFEQKLFLFSPSKEGASN